MNEQQEDPEEEYYDDDEIDLEDKSEFEKQQIQVNSILSSSSASSSF